MRRQIKRAGLHLYEEWSSSDPLERMPFSTDLQRLEWAEEQAKRYPYDAVLHREIDWVRRHIHVQSQAVMFALDSIQRGIWLLDTGEHLRNVRLGYETRLAKARSRQGKRGKIDHDRTKDSDAEIYAYWKRMKAEHRDFTKRTADHFRLDPRTIYNIVQREAKVSTRK